MTQKQIDNLVAHGDFPEPTGQRRLITTHISWVIVCDHYVYKIKKAIRYSFLDFSTLKLRKFFCEREIELNNRLARGIYIEVLPICRINGQMQIGGKEGSILEYAVKMRKMDPEKQMDLLISQNKVQFKDIEKLAECIADFHKKTSIIHKKEVLEIKEKFNDLAAEKKFLLKELGHEGGVIIDKAIAFSDAFLTHNKTLLTDRLKLGYYRDGHGDLHTRNIFLLPAPQPFDCIEFNDDYRQIDVLNEIAFLCMDLDALDKKEFSERFIDQYNKLFPAMRTPEERRLFVYYKMYRANVRAKVNSLRAKSAPNATDKQNALDEVLKYLAMLEHYRNALE
jgi:aminoglycoside phosphotransferase family enzyme